MTNRNGNSTSRIRSLIIRGPAVLLAVGVASFVGVIGSPNLAGASTASAVHTSIHHGAVRHAHALRPSFFNAGRVNLADRSSAEARPSSAPSVTPPPTLYVNGSTGNDVGSCRLESNPCLTIDYAITEAPTSAIIDVAAGTYAEQLVDSAKKLSIVGASESGTIIEPTSLTTSDTDPDDSSVPIYAIVDAQPGTKVKLSNLTIDGEGATNQFDGCQDNFVGVYYHNAKGKLSNVDVENIVLPQADFGCQDGLAVYAASAAGSTTKVKMNSVTVTNYDKNGITCDDAGTTCTISDSTVTGIGSTGLIGQNGIQGYGAHTVTLTDDNVTENTYSGPSYVATGVLLYDNVTSTVTGTTTDSDDVGIYAGNDGGGPSITTIDISGSTASDATYVNQAGGVGMAIDSGTAGSIENNTLMDDPGDGLGLYSASGMTVSGNTAEDSYDGIYIGGPGSAGTKSKNNMVASNTASSNTNDGIHVDTDTSANTFTSNTADSNLNYDYQDASTGGRTAGTANTWSHDSCTPASDSQPEGLC
jgi:parallel beta-helix repeat protein